MAVGMGQPRIPRHRAEDGRPQRGQRAAQHRLVAGAADPVQDNAGDAQAGIVRGKAGDERGDRLRHPARIDHEHHRQGQVAGEVRHRAAPVRRRAVEEAHRPLDQQKARPRGEPRDRGAVHRPGVEVRAGRAAGGLVETGVDVVGAGLGAAHRHPGIAQGPQYAQRHRGLAGPRARGGEDQAGHGGIEPLARSDRPGGAAPRTPRARGAGVTRFRPGGRGSAGRCRAGPRHAPSRASRAPGAEASRDRCR